MYELLKQNKHCNINFKVDGKAEKVGLFQSCPTIDGFAIES